LSRLVVVGCGTVVPEPDRGCSSYFLELGGGRILLDCGAGTVQSLARLGLPWAKLSDLVITHFHADHVGALPGLMFALKYGMMTPRGDDELVVWGPPGTKKLFDSLAAALGEYMVEPGFPLLFRELRPGERAGLPCGVELSVHKTVHTDESHAVRLDGPEAAVGYTGDTGPAPGLGEFFAGVDLLVSECSLTDGEVGDNHLSPARVAEIARESEPGLLLLSHIYPHVRESHDVPSLVAAADWSGRALVAMDGLSVDLPALSISGPARES
jgi:ribonuclease BN (tRNA processing enzyme)